jgi:hypothetical protein
VTVCETCPSVQCSPPIIRSSLSPPISHQSQRHSLSNSVLSSQSRCDLPLLPMPSDHQSIFNYDKIHSTRGSSFVAQGFYISLVGDLETQPSSIKRASLSMSNKAKVRKGGMETRLVCCLFVLRNQCLFMATAASYVHLSYIVTFIQRQSRNHEVKIFPFTMTLTPFDSGLG